MVKTQTVDFLQRREQILIYPKSYSKIFHLFSFFELCMKKYMFNINECWIIHEFTNDNFLVIVTEIEVMLQVIRI